MANGNPYYIQPGVNLQPGLQGLGQSLMQFQQMRQLQKEKQQQQKRSAAIDAIYKGLANPEEIPALANEMGAPQIAESYSQDPEGTVNKLKRLAAGLDPVRYRNYIAGFEIAGGKGQKAKQKTGSFLVKNPETGQTAIATGVFDPISGKLSTATAEMSGWQVVSKLGETAGEETARKIEQKTGEVRAVKGEERAANLINEGITAAESTAQMRRAMDLLKNVKTGGFHNIALKAKRIFGVEGADEGELSNNLGKTVLSQLRSTFGAAFTEEEGNRLMRIEASFGKSPETNMKLLQQALRIAERKAKRARVAAEKRGDMDTVQEIDDLLNFSLSDQSGAPSENLKDTPSEDIKNQLKNFGFNF